MMKRRPPAGSVRRPQIKGVNTRGVFTSTTGRLVQFESQAEWALILHLDRDPTIRDYGTWLETFSVAPPDTPNQPQSYTPQCMVWRHAEPPEIHRVVHHDQWTPGGRALGDPLGPQLCLARGWTYVAHRAEHLTAPTPFANLQALVRYRPHAYHHPDVANYAHMQIPLGETRAFASMVGHIMAALNLPRPTVVAGLCHLVWHGVLGIDMNRLLLLHGDVAPYVVLNRLPHPQASL